MAEQKKNEAMQVIELTNMWSGVNSFYIYVANGLLRL